MVPMGNKTRNKTGKRMTSESLEIERRTKAGRVKYWDIAGG